MEPALSGTLLKAAGAASGPIARKVGRATVRMRVAWTVARQARKRDIRITAKALRTWLARSDTQEQLRVGSATTVATSIHHLEWLLPGDDYQRSRDASTILFLVLAAFLRAQDRVAATALAHEWQVEQTHKEARETRETIQATGQSILNRLSTSETFPEQVRTLHPWRRETALAIRSSWPNIEVLVNAITSTADRRALLRQWAKHPPDWYAQAPAEVACWLGELAADYGGPEEASQFLADGVARGAFPAGYWAARRALLQFEDRPLDATRILESNTDPHPLVTCLLAWRQEAWQDAIDALAPWNPGSDRDRDLKQQLLARLAAVTGDLNGAVTLALQAAEVEGASGAAILAAELLLSRARYGQTIHRLVDAEQASALAARARNARRSWQGDSVAAVLVAVKAAGLSGNPARAWALTQMPPEGDATEAEVADLRLLRETVRLAALTGRFEQARTLAQLIYDPFVKAEITAVELTEQGKRPEATAAWKAALGAAVDDTDTLAAAMGLAELGIAVPDLGDLERAHPELVQEIRVVQQAMAADGGDLEALRAGAGESLILTVKLSERHRDRGEPQMAGDVLRAGAERWAEPRMMLMAARQYREAGDLDAAREAAESSLTSGGPGWAGEFDARAFLLEVHGAFGDWEKATQQARVLVTLDSHDADARWALVHCLVRRGDLAAAWSALTPEGEPVPPRNRHDALTWIALAARHDSSPHFVTRALATMGRWSDDEQLIGVFIGHMYTGLRREDLTPNPEDLAALHAATAEYTERFPDSTVFRAVQIPREDPLAPLAAELRRGHEALEEIDREVREGRLPLGMLAEATGRSYAEASLKRAAGFVCCHDPARHAEGRAAAAAALDRPVVIDTTAAHTLTLLDVNTRSRLVAVFAQVLSTDPAYHDALRGHESLGLMSTMSVGWDPATGKPTVTTIEESVAAGLADRAEQLCEILRGAVRRPWPRLKTLQNLPGRSDWLASLDMAATDKHAYWCDDAVLGSIAASGGVATFDTVDLLRYLNAEGRLTHDLLMVSEATLLFNYYADLGFEHAALEFAATMDGWRPRGAAFAVTRPAAWTDPAVVMNFVFRAAEQCAVALEDLEGWATAAALGLVRIAPNDAAAGDNLRVLMGQFLAQPWMRPERLPAVLRAVRAAQKERVGITDPLPPVLAETFRTLVRQHGHALAAPLLMSLVRFAPESDQFAAARVVLTHKD
jgi:hypothetical protein